MALGLLLLWLATASFPLAAPAEEVGSGDAYVAPLPKGAVARVGSPVWNMGRDVNALVFSRDGKLLVSASDDFTVRILEVATGREKLRIGLWAAKLTDVALSPDGNMLAAASKDAVWVWDAKTGERIQRIDSGQRWVIFAPDGKHLLTASQGTPVQTWNVETGERGEVFGDKKPTSGLQFTPDGKLLAITHAHEIVFWNWEEKKEVSSLQVDKKFILTGKVVVAPLANLAAAVSSHGWAHVWDTKEGKLLASLKDEEADVTIKAVALSAGGKALYTGDRLGRIEAWDWKNEKAVAISDRHHQTIASLAVSPDGKMLAVGGGGNSGPIDFAISRWSIDGGELKPLSPANNPGAVTGMDVTPDGKTIALAHANEMFTVWDRTTGKLLRKCRRDGQVDYADVAVSPDGKWLAVAGKPDVLLMPTRGDGESVELQTDEGVPLQTVVFTADGKYVAAGCLAGKLFIWDVASRKLLHTINAHATQIWALAASPDGKTIGTGSFDRHTAIWDAASGRELGKWKTHTSFVRGVAFSHDGTRMASVGQGQNQIAIREVATGEIIRQMPTDWAPTTVAFCDGGRTLVTGHFHDRFKFWDLATGEMFYEWRPQDGPYTLELMALPDSQSMVSSQTDSTAVVWDLKPIFAKLPALPRAALTNEQLKQFWSVLSENDARRADAAMWTLVSAEGTSRFLQSTLVTKPVEVNEAVVEKLVVDLDSDEFIVREAAERELQIYGAAIAERLEKELADTESAEVRVRVVRLLKRISGTPGGLSPQQLQAARGIHALACLGTPAAMDALKAVADSKSDPWRARLARRFLEQVKAE